MTTTPIQSLNQALEWAEGPMIAATPQTRATPSWQRRLIEATAWVVEDCFVALPHQRDGQGRLPTMAFPLAAHPQSHVHLEFNFRPPLVPGTRMTKAEWVGPSSVDPSSFVSIGMPWETLKLPQVFQRAWQEGWLDEALPACISTGRFVKPVGSGLKEALAATFDFSETLSQAWQSELLASRLSGAWVAFPKMSRGPRL